MSVKVPASLKLDDSLSFLTELHGLPHQEEYVIDFSELQHMPPFGSLLISSFMRQFIQKRFDEHKSLGLLDPIIQAVGYKGKSYASHMGFFKSFNLDYGKEPGEAKGSGTYLPIKRIKIENLKFRASQGYTEVGDEIVDESRKIATILSQTDSGDFFDTLVYAFTEIFRNTVEHSGADSIWYSAQYWPTKNVVEIGVLDEGMGIHKSLSTNPDLKILDESHAMYLSLMPGVSRNVRLGNKKRVQLSSASGWDNSGYGLYMTSQIAGYSAGFIMLSGATAVNVSHGSLHPFVIPTICGTAIRIKLDTSELGSLQARLASLREKARTKFGAEDIASKSSTARYLFGD